MPQARPESMEMTQAHFSAICRLVRELSGINLSSGKEGLVRARVGRRLRSLKMASFGEYLDYLRCEGRGEEIARLLDTISTNVTSFFREPDHFRYLRNVLLPRLAARDGKGERRLRIWSAGCSSGEEPYSIAIHLCEGVRHLEHWDAKVLATDLSTSALERARAGSYADRQIEDVPVGVRSRYFEVSPLGEPSKYRIGDQMRGLVRFARLNLIGRWPMQGPFDAIFCRNVMIYFDKPTQSRLVERYRELLGSGGTLFIGHSESLAKAGSGFQHVRSTIDEKR